MLHLYGIKNCDTMKKAVAWLGQQDLPYTFHDYKQEGVTLERLSNWAERLGWEALLNTRGTTWRKLDDAERSGLDRDKALALMQRHTSLIRRPVVEAGAVLLLGFDAEQWSVRLLGAE